MKKEVPIYVGLTTCAWLLGVLTLLWGMPVQGPTSLRPQVGVTVQSQTVSGTRFHLGGSQRQTLLPQESEQDHAAGEPAGLSSRRRRASQGAETLLVPVEGGGEVALPRFHGSETACRGYVGRLPVHRFDYPAGGTLAVFFEGSEDALLLLVGPAGEIRCNEDSGPDNLNPALVVQDATPGLYDVFLVSHTRDQAVVGVLTVTSNVRAAPVTLAPNLLTNSSHR